MNFKKAESMFSAFCVAALTAMVLVVSFSHRLKALQAALAETDSGFSNYNIAFSVICFFGGLGVIYCTTKSYGDHAYQYYYPPQGNDDEYTPLRGPTSQELPDIEQTEPCLFTPLITLDMATFYSAVSSTSFMAFVHDRWVSQHVNWPLEKTLAIYSTPFLMHMFSGFLSQLAIKSPRNVNGVVRMALNLLSRHPRLFIRVAVLALAVMYGDTLFKTLNADLDSIAMSDETRHMIAIISEVFILSASFAYYVSTVNSMLESLKKHCDDFEKVYESESVVIDGLMNFEHKLMNTNYLGAMFTGLTTLLKGATNFFSFVYGIEALAWGLGFSLTIDGPSRFILPGVVVTSGARAQYARLASGKASNADDENKSQFFSCCVCCDDKQVTLTHQN